MLYYTKIFTLFFTILFFQGLSFSAPGSLYTVTAVHDGDTISVRELSLSKSRRVSEKLRLIGIDAPELGQGRWGLKAKKRLRDIIASNNRLVNIEFDIEKRDRHGRLLGYIWSRNGNLINEQLLIEGLAVIYTVPPNVRYSKRFAEAQRKARSERVGVWGRDGLKKKPADWRKENTPYLHR